MEKHFNGLFKSFKIIERLLILVLGFSALVKANNPYPVPVGRITLLNLEHGNLRTIITNKVNHEVLLTMPTRYSEAYAFECNGSYPLEWNYIGDGAPTATADVGRHFKDFYDVNSYTYQSVLFLYDLAELQSGRYVCRGSNPPQEQLQIFYDLFVPGNRNQTFLSTVEKQVFIPETKPIAILPCTITDPNAMINLYKGTYQGTYERIETNQSIIFIPKKGFRLKMHELPDPYGSYMCTTYDNKRRRKINLIPERLKSKYEASSPLTGKIPVQFSYDYEFNRVLCCTGTSFVPKLQWAGCGSVLDCKIKSVCFEEDRCEPRLASNGNGVSKWVDPGPLPKGCAGWKLRDDDPNGDHGIFKCSSPGVSQYQPYLLNRGNIFLDFAKAPPSEAILSLVKTSDEITYVGSEVEYHCNSTRFYFAYGIRWAFQRGNGDIEFVDDSSVVKDRFALTAHRRQTTFKIIHKDIKAIICFVPIANSATEWRTVSLPILVRESFNIPLPMNNGNSRPQEFLSNEIPYSSQPNLYEPQSTVRPKDYFNYHTSDDLLSSNNNPPEVILGSSKSSPASIVRPQPLHAHGSQTRDYLYSSNNNNNHNPSTTLSKNVPLTRPHKLTIWDDPPAASFATSGGHEPSGYFNIHTNQYEPLRSSNGMEFVSSTQPSPTIKPKLNYEAQLPDLRHKSNSWSKYPNEFQQFPTQPPPQRFRDDYNNYETSTSSPRRVFFDYRPDSNEHKLSKPSLPKVLSSVRTSPTPMVQPVIHFDNKDKEYSLRYPSKTFSNAATGHSQRIKDEHSNHYPTQKPTQRSPYYFNDKESYSSGSRLPSSKPVLSPQEDSHAPLYGDNYRSSSSSVERVNLRKNRLKSTTASPQYYNYNQSSPHYQTDSWERPPAPPSYKNYDDYDRDRQYYNVREPSSLKQVEEPSSVSTDEHFYYQRYASDSQEFPIQQSDPVHNANSYSNDNFIRRSDNLYGDSVPLVELG